MVFHENPSRSTGSEILIPCLSGTDNNVTFKSLKSHLFLIMLCIFPIDVWKTAKNKISVQQRVVTLKACSH